MSKALSAAQRFAELRSSLPAADKRALLTHLLVPLLLHAPAGPLC
jgi:hypothetical protein